MTENTVETGAFDRAPIVTRERAAVALMFLMNGFMVGAWAPKIPEFAGRLGLGEGALGLMILVFGLGSIVMMPLAGMQIARFGSTWVTRIAAVLGLPTLILLSLVSTVFTGALAIFLFGGLIGAMDVAMNANAVATEKHMRRSIMSSCHAFWSLGGLIGSASGGYLIATFGVVGHSLLVTGFAVLLVAIAWPMLLIDTPHPEDARQKLRLPRSPLPWLIGFVALFSMVPEGAIIDWGALYLRKELGASVELSGLAFGAFSFTMAIMRFAGDLVRDRFGAVNTLRFCTLASIIGLVTAGFASGPAMAIIGFAIAGIGISNMVPIAFSAAGNLPGMAQGIGLSVVTTMGYSGILVAPSLIGFIAEHMSLAAIFAGLALLHLVVLGLSGLARHADRPAPAS
ncbi:MFS transporter [Rhizobium sp. FY34]|uniref:MFS transporter n=1 Tax=Rhizobium sp. FY34 TaxID=2562309 RepID=UPI001FEE3400|nr:MFS transporter [Rhizobium sp. FY34]